LDGIYEPEGHDGPVYVIEFQAQHAAGAWYNLLTKLGLYGQLHPRRTVQGLLIFLHTGDDPGAPPGAEPPLCTAAYLDDLLPRWLEREPENPFVVVLAPLIDALRAYAPRALRTIRKASLAPTTRATLERMLEFWLIERFPLLSSEELLTMLNVLVPLEQTRVYQEIFAKGEAKGKADGEAKGKADGLKRLLTRRFGVLPRWAVQRLEGAAIAQLDSWLEECLMRRAWSS
jgi:hypothetical protein